MYRIAATASRTARTTNTRFFSTVRPSSSQINALAPAHICIKNTPADLITTIDPPPIREQQHRRHRRRRRQGHREGRRGRTEGQGGYRPWHWKSAGQGQRGFGYCFWKGERACRTGARQGCGARGQGQGRFRAGEGQGWTAVEGMML